MSETNERMVEQNSYSFAIFARMEKGGMVAPTRASAT
jgi:hypothetical protein